MAINLIEQFKAKRQQARELAKHKERAYYAAYSEASKHAVEKAAYKKARSDAKKEAHQRVFGSRSPFSMGLGIDRQRAQGIINRERQYATAYDEAFSEPPVRRVRARMKVRHKKRKTKPKVRYTYRRQPTQDSFWL